MSVRLWAVVVLLTLLAGCAGYPDVSRERFQTLPQHYKQFDVAMSWETKVSGNETLVDGLVQNLRYAQMRDLEIWVGVLDPQGKVVARSVDYVIPIQLGIDEIAPFDVKIPTPARSGARLRFTYRYWGFEGRDDGVQWMQSFDAAVP